VTSSGFRPHSIDPLRFCALDLHVDDRRHALIARSAYFRAEQRGFAPGHELDDWLAAETEVEQRWAARRSEAVIY
jgi:Protein of unknown function (DUF2934)